MATKKKVKAVEPEEVSSVEPEVAAVPMTMAAVTPRSNGQSTNGFAKVEQGKSYVLSVNAPSGSGEVELLAADSDTQSEPDMFSLLYTKVENSMQIPFVAVSSWVYVQAGNSSINWLVTPANFSLAVPGVSSGGGESFDPEAPQEISGDWQFTGELTRTVKASPEANDILNKAMGDNLYMTLDTDNIMYTHFAYLTSAETKGIVAPVVALPAEAPEGFYRVKLWFGPETSSEAGSQPCDIWITTTSSSVSLPNISSNTANLSVSLNRSSQLLVKGLDGNIYTCVFASMGKRFIYPADSTLIGGELHVYHSASTPGSVKLSFKASSAEEEHDVVRVSFFQISGPVNQSE